MNQSIERLARDICNDIEIELQRSGIFFRIFVRAKTEDSIKKKLKLNNYASSPTNKLMQDVIGIRITLYFEDDLPIVYNALKRKSGYIDETIDEPEVHVFKPTRINLIFRMNETQSEEITDIVVRKFTYIDTTFEIQLRTVLSEGWHEVEHDLRYKCKDDWVDHSDISHIFNGVYASLVTSDWSILSIFEKLAYRHYRGKNWPALLRNKFRLRFKEGDLDLPLLSILNNDNALTKDLYKIDRNDLMQRIFNDGIRIPLTLSNLIFILNAYYFKNSSITNLAPEFITTNKKLYS
jgi:ppGpp synthetase/RelA/SpoT-type nucleotidyltranferase